MNKIKIILVLLTVVAGIGGATYYFTRPSADGVVTPGKSTIKEDTVEKSIQEKIEQAPNNKFCAAVYEEIMKQIELFFADEPTNLQTYTTMLRGAYTRKFIEQANYVFDRTEWNRTDIKTIREGCAQCLSFSPDAEGLKNIQEVLKDYDALVAYDKQVNTACSQRPKCLRDKSFLYKDDDWNIKQTENLLASIPILTSKVKNSPIYAQTRKVKVENRLKEAHCQFIVEKMKCAEQEAKGYNYNPARYSDWLKMCGIFYADFQTYNSQWNKNVSLWQQQVASWEKYCLPQTNN